MKLFTALLIGLFNFIAMAQQDGNLSVNVSNFPNLDRVLKTNGPVHLLWWGDSTGAYTVPWITGLLTGYTTNSVQLTSSLIGGGQWYEAGGGSAYRYETQPNYYWVPSGSYAMPSGSDTTWGGPSQQIQFAHGNQVQLWIECSATNGTAMLYTSTDFNTWIPLGILNEATAGQEGTILCTNFPVALGYYAIKLACSSGTFRWFGNAGVTQTNSSAAILSVCNAGGETLQAWAQMGPTNIGILLSNLNPTVTFYQQNKPLNTYYGYTNYASLMSNDASNSDNCLIAGEITPPNDEALDYPINDTYQKTLFSRQVALSNNWAFIDCFSGTLASWSAITNLGFNLDSVIHLNSAGINFNGEEFGFRSQFASHWIGAGLFNACFSRAEGQLQNCSGWTSLTFTNGAVIIADNAFMGCVTLTNLILPSGVNNIGANAFADCTALTNVTISSGTSSIGDGAFSYCPNLVSITIPDTVTHIGAEAFFHCSNLTNVIIGNSVANIGSNAFFGCEQLVKITISDSVTNIADAAFYDCFSLSNIEFTGNAPIVGTNVFLDDSNAMALYLPGTIGWSATFAGIPSVAVVVTSNQLAITNVNYVPNSTGGLQVTITPTNAISSGAQWRVDASSNQNSGTLLTNLAVGTHLISFTPASGWLAPMDLYVTVSNGLTTAIAEIYTNATTQTPASWPIFVTNGSGIIRHPRTLANGGKYTVTASAKAGNIFAAWVGGSNPPYVVLGTNASLAITNESGLLLEADFVTNAFLAAHGTYYGLFGPEDVDRLQTNSGSIRFTVTTGGGISGNLQIGSQMIPLIGKFSVDGSAIITSKRRGQNTLTTTLQMDLSGQSVSGEVTDAVFAAGLTTYQDVFNAHEKATNYAGRYTLILPGSTNASIGPFGTSCGTLTVTASGNITFSGKLADGTPITESSVVSANGYWPMYVPLYGGKGSLWSWNYFTNGEINSPSYASWINTTNSNRSSDYHFGFTNQMAAVVGAKYASADMPLLALTNGAVRLEGGGLPETITNVIGLTSEDRITFTNSGEDTNRMRLSINSANGAISGSFSSLGNPSKTITISGVLIQNQTNAHGFFLGTNQSGTFILTPQ